MATIEIDAESLNAGCDTKGLYMVVKVRDHTGNRLDLADNKRMLAVIRRNLI